MRPEIDDAGREQHPRPAVLVLLCAPALAHLGGVLGDDSGTPATGAVLWVGLVVVLGAYVRASSRGRPAPPAGPRRRAGDRA